METVFALLLAALAILAPRAAAGATRVYFIGADQVSWNYAPGGDKLDNMCGDNAADVWLKRGLNGEPPIFRKAVFRQYTDGTFQTLAPRGPEWEHLGLLGPVIRAEVGDQIVVTLKNNTLIPVSLHPHGVFYRKADEGSGYPDGTGGADLAGDAVAPGRTFTYHWDVPERAGPGPNDPSSVAWLYHSHVNPMRDTAAGLIGVIIVTRKGEARPDGSPKDVDREFVALFSIFDETVSEYSVVNTRLFAPGTAAAATDKDDRVPVPIIPGASIFAGTPDANRFFAINGYVFGNVPGLRMKVGQRVRWYLAGMGGESDLHTPHWHGNVALVDGHRVDVVNLLPATTQVADMVPDDPGIWLFHCHVEDHMEEGMSALYEVDR